MKKRGPNPDRQIETAFLFDRSVSVDHARVGQMFANLLSMAVTHGAKDALVRVIAKTDQDGFELAVKNGGEPIPASVINQLFQPFYRGDARNTQGLGLGLFIASQIAEAHGGRIDVRSDVSETAFTFRMDVARISPNYSETTT